MELRTPREVIDCLGGLGPVAKLTGRTPQAVWNWTQLDRFPANTYIVLSRAIAQHHHQAPPSLWGMTEAAAE